MAPFASPYLTLVFPHPEWTGGKAGNYASEPLIWLNTLFTAANPDPTLTLDLDDQMVMLLVVANHLAQNQNPLGKTKYEQFTQQLNFIRSNEPRRDETYVMGGDRSKEPVRLASIQVVAVHG